MTDKENAFDLYSQVLNLTIIEDRPAAEALDPNSKKGVITIRGKAERIFSLVDSLIDKTNEHKIGKPNTKKGIRTNAPNGQVNIDLNIPKEDGTIVMIRVNSQRGMIGKDSTELEFAFGEGGNDTLYTDMVLILKQALDSLLSPTS